VPSYPGGVRGTTLGGRTDRPPGYARPVSRTRIQRARRAPALLLLAASLATAGCGGGGGEGAPPVPGTPGSGAGSGDEFRSLVVSVCTDTTRGVPPVPGADASEAESRRYVVAVRRASTVLAADLERLATQRQASRASLRGMAARTRSVSAVAGRTSDGRATGGETNDLAVAIARMNDAATSAGLPQCGL
jgi:hypothetical protein